MCSLNSVGKITKAYFSTCVSEADLAPDTPPPTEASPAECSTADRGPATSPGGPPHTLPLLYRTRPPLASDAKRRQAHPVNATRRRKGISILVQKHCPVDESPSFASLSPPPSPPPPRPNSAPGPRVRAPKPRPLHTQTPRTPDAAGWRAARSAL